MNRRTFFQKAGWGSLLITGHRFPWHAAAGPEIKTLTILHTNDVHSRIDPFPMDGSWRAGLGGAARRAAMIREIRQSTEQVLLLDAGDIFQGTPYFNFFKGEIEMKVMSEMKYDAATIGNHDFDAGIEGLKKQLAHAQFPMINCNYDFSDTVMHDQAIPRTIFERGDLRIGVLGVGIELEGLVPAELYRATRYMDPIRCANEEAAILKEEGCDLIICLSHLGYKYKSLKVSDVVLAQESRNIDVIIGGHTHTFMKAPEAVENKDGEAVLINQVGWAGLMLGRIDIRFERNGKGRCVSCGNTWIK
jgi:5'-nucleotidase